MIEQQYEMVRSSRIKIFAFLETLPPGIINVPVEAFNNKCISYLLAHNVNTYRAWIANRRLGSDVSYLDEDLQNYTLEQLRQSFLEVDGFMQEFITKTAKDLFNTIEVQRPQGIINISMLKLFIHVTTHEFHHKGQLMTMIRLLGHEPIDADVIS